MNFIFYHIFYAKKTKSFELILELITLLNPEPKLMDLGKGPTFSNLMDLGKGPTFSNLVDPTSGLGTTKK